MKISRNGVEIELTQSELEEAFDEITNAGYVEDFLKVAKDMDYELNYEEAVRLIPEFINLLSFDSYYQTIEILLENSNLTRANH